MGRDSRKARKKELRRAAERHLAEKRRRRGQRTLITVVVVGLVMAFGLGGTFGVLALINNPSPSASPAPTPSIAASPVATVCRTTPPTSKPSTLNQSSMPKMSIDKAASYVATMKTSCGRITVDLFAKQSPITVNNFIYLAKKKWYDGSLFHRIANGIQIIQGGDPSCTSIIGTAAALGSNSCGMGGPGYSIPDEYSNGLKFKVGSMAMANTGQPNSGGSQFFFVTGPAGLKLPPKYTIFGQVEKSSLPVIQKIQSVPVGGQSGDTPLEKVWIYSVTIQKIKK